MPQLTVTKLYQDGQVLTENQLDAAFSSIETFLNVIGVGPDNIQDNSIGAAEIQTGSVTESKLATDAVSTVKVLDGAITQAKLAAALQQLLIPTSTVLSFGGDTAPSGFLLCDGQAYNRVTYATLFAVVGVRFGNGDGTTTFNVPDLRGRYVRGVDGSTGRDPDAGARTAMNTGGATGGNVGSVQDDQFASHVHGYVISQSGGAFGNPPFGGSGDSRVPNTVQTQPSGGNETRGKNAYLNFLIKV